MAGPSCLTGVETKETARSRKGTKYRTFDGGIIYNNGQQDFVVVFNDGTTLTMKQPTTYVTKPFLSVRRLCETGH